jgi:hypothetical protein
MNIRYNRHKKYVTSTESETFRTRYQLILGWKLISNRLPFCILFKFCGTPYKSYKSCIKEMLLEGRKLDIQSAG